MALFSGIAVEDMFAGLTALPSGWSVEWVVSWPTLTLLIDVSYFYTSVANNDTLMNCCR